MDEFTQVTRVNAVAPVYVAECFVEYVAASEMKMPIFIVTRSVLSAITAPVDYAYCCSNAAMNMAIKAYPSSSPTAASWPPSCILAPSRPKPELGAMVFRLQERHRRARCY